jgi:hypothetical protein
MQAEERAWKFHRGQWEEIEEGVIRLISEERADDLNDALVQSGYEEEPIIQFGHIEEHRLSVEVYGAALGKTPAYPYYVMAEVGNADECVYITDFPSLVQFLSQMGSIFNGLSFGTIPDIG